MKQEMRTVRYDPLLKVEAYHFQGVMQEFCDHFHDYYVIGFIEKGRRDLLCNQQKYTIAPGDLLLLNPRDVHACRQTDVRGMDYRCINIEPQTMGRAVFEITGTEVLPRFTSPVVFHSELVPPLRELHRMLMGGEEDLRKEELFFFLLGQIMGEHAGPQSSVEESAPASGEMMAVCAFLEEHCTEPITLQDLCELTGLSKYYLLRSFTKAKGISPYRYLETMRIDRAKKMLEGGAAPIHVAMGAGFSDQSHFSNSFKRYIGLTPKQYGNIFKDTCN